MCWKTLSCSLFCSRQTRSLHYSLSRFLRWSLAFQKCQSANLLGKPPLVPLFCSRWANSLGGRTQARLMPSLLPETHQHPCLPLSVHNVASHTAALFSTTLCNRTSSNRHVVETAKSPGAVTGSVFASQPVSLPRSQKIGLPGFFSKIGLLHFIIVLLGCQDFSHLSCDPRARPLSCLIPSASFELQSRPTHRSRAACFVARFFHTQHSIPLAFGEHGRCPINQDPS